VKPTLFVSYLEQYPNQMLLKISEINPDRWRHLDEIFHAAVDQLPAQRSQFIDTACLDDPTLRTQIEALLTADASGWDFLEEPAVELAAPFVSEDQPQFTTGQQIGEYTILELIGRGGMGEVYLAKDPVLNRRVAIKLLPSDYTRDENRLRRFQKEAQAASALNHPNILTIYQLGDYDGVQFIVTEFVEGETIRDLISRGPLELPQVIDVAIQVSSALSAAHKTGIVHRDIKPENLMVRPDGYVKILDFGLAKLAEQPDSSIGSDAPYNPNLSSALLMGTVRYMSPEQARGLRLDARSDIYSLGVVLYEMLAGRPPFESRDSRQLIESIIEANPIPLESYRGDLPAALIGIVTKALRKDREQRYQSAESLSAELRTLRAEVKPNKRRLMFTAAAMLVIGLFVLAGFMLYQRATRSLVSAASSSDKKVFAGRWSEKASISIPRRDTPLAVLGSTIYVAGGWNICTPYANLESYDEANDRWISRAPMHVARGGHGFAELNGLLYVVGGRVDCGKTTDSVEAYDPQTDTWSDRARLPSPRGGAAVVSANGKLYAMGGSRNEQVQTFNAEYDPAKDGWIERAPLPQPRDFAAAVVIGNTIYVMGGGPNPETTRSVDAYDFVADKWQSKAPMPVGRAQFGAAVLNNRIYVFGGNGNSGQVDAYDPASDSWFSGPSMPAIRAGFGAIAFAGSIYFAGGQDESTHLASVMTFTPCFGNGTWITKAPMPTARESAAIGQINGIVYVAGGYTAPWSFHRENEAYDPRSDKWITKAPMPTARETSGTNGAVVDGKMYVIGGNAGSEGGFGSCTNANEAYDPVSDRWAARAPMPTARCHVAAVALNGLIYVVGGTNTSGSIRYQLVEIYDPVTNSWTSGPPMPTARDHVTASVIDGIIYVAGGLKLSGALNTLEAFDPKAKTWSVKATMPTPRANHAAGAMDGLLFVVGGENDLRLVLTIDVYDPRLNHWTTLPFPPPTPRNQPAILPINNSLFVIGGGVDASATRNTAVNEQFIFPSCMSQTASSSPN
jgi:serine/threonine protein kinase/N-acetylneuraminic acid mutarotase